MATIPSPRTWTVAELLTAAKLNTDVRDAINFLLAVPLAVLHASAGTSCGTNAHTAIAFAGTEDIDRDGGHSTVTNTSRYTSQTAGWYHVSGVVAWNSTSGYGEAYQRKNGTTKHSSFSAPNSVSHDRRYNPNGKMFLGVGDYAELIFYHEVGSTVTTNATDSRFELQWIST